MALILVVDDYPDARLLLSYVLEDAGFQLVFAGDGPEAIAMARARRPDAIVMDLHLPGMSGIEATRVLRADPHLADIPVVAHTLSSHPVDDDRHLFAAVITKPHPDGALVDALRAALGR